MGRPFNHLCTRRKHRSHLKIAPVAQWSHQARQTCGALKRREPPAFTSREDTLDIRTFREVFEAAADLLIT